MNLRQTLDAALSEALSDVCGQQVPAMVAQAKNPEHGDYQANGALAAARSARRNPRELGQAALDLADLDDLVEHADIAGPGFINLKLRDSVLIDQMRAPLQSPNLGKQTIVVDYSSPNLAKEMHVGHLRSTIIGDAMARLLEYLGHTVIRQNHVGDWGTQFGKLLVEFEANGTDTSSLEDLETFYSEASKRYDEDKTFAEAARARVVDLQSGEATAETAWRKFIDISLSHCQAIYERLGVTLTSEHLAPESGYAAELPHIIQTLADTGLLEASDGAQSLHFDLLFEVGKRAGLAGHASLEHHPFGLMLGADGSPYRTRDGKTVKLASLLDEAESRALDVVSEKNPDMDLDARRKIARVIAIGAIKYADLSKHRTSDYVFDWDRMLSFEGNTAPYLLYAYTRTKRILDKAPRARADFAHTALGTTERDLALHLARFPGTLGSVAISAEPHRLCTYLWQLSALLMKFYESSPVLKSEGATQALRLRLCERTAETLKRGLELLGIETLERM